MKDRIRINSIKAALKEQGLQDMYNRLCEIMPDITNQYTYPILDTEYLRVKVRAMHAFQLNLAQEAVKRSKKKKLTVVDVGDSSGTHLNYLMKLNPGKKIIPIGLNLDKKAVKRIKSKGIKGICCRAEKLSSKGIDADIFMSFQMVEHLPDPIKFFKSIADNSKCEYFVVTVPYVKNSRAGFHHIRHSQKRKTDAEDVHIFELSPEDWKLLFMHSGWKIVKEKVYLQYPRKKPLRLMKKYWKKHDFEGFYGVILKRDDTWSRLYQSW